MMWIVETLNEKVDAEIAALPLDMRVFGSHLGLYRSRRLAERP